MKSEGESEKGRERERERERDGMKNREINKEQERSEGDLKV